MTLTPDRTPGHSEERDPRPGTGDAIAGDDAASEEAEASSSADGPPSLFDQLKDSDFDLTGHPLAKKFESLPAVPTGDHEDPIDQGQEGESSGQGAADDQGEVGTDVSVAADDNETEGVSDVTEPLTGDGFAAASPAPTLGASADNPVSDASSSSPHPLLSSEEWTDLARFAPEVTTSLTALSGLKDGLRTFDRRMGPDDAIKLIDGLEALGRVNEALSTLALAVCERVGTPTDYGAKTTKALIQDRLNITSREASRRTDMAKNLGGRVTLTGQPQAPVCPIVADAFNEG
ncbi:DUF222 domain-containing protein, partial [Brevibacterium sp. FME37]|uniref:DUF222 domain-containing protein n=1 Tax=Brevibacterium sp. FME37 TaxID=2742607 RepID=UPI001D019CCD